MSNIDLGQQARVIWLTLSAAGPGGREAREFETLMRAVSFVMEDLPEAERATAVIAIEQMPGTLALERIEEIYANLTKA